MNSLLLVSPELRHWLREDYARDGKLRTKFDGLAMKGVPPQVVRFAELTDDNGSWREEQSRLKSQMPGRYYGGLTWNEVVQLVHRYQAGNLDPGTFLLVRQWREAGKASPGLMWAGLAFLESVFPLGKRRLLKHLNQAHTITAPDNCASSATVKLESEAELDGGVKMRRDGW